MSVMKIMQREVGSRDFPIWLLGDSNPPQWETSLKTPFDRRHPIRHNIWTSVLDVIQEKVFREARLRVETRWVYIRNAVGNLRIKPKTNSLEWLQTTEQEMNEFQGLVQKHTPKFILSFGAFSFEFARRALNDQPKQKFGSWGALRLGEEFQWRISQFDPNAVNLLPLLHRSVSGENLSKVTIISVVKMTRTILNSWAITLLTNYSNIGMC